MFECQLLASNSSKEAFCLMPYSVSDVQKVLLIALDPSKSPGLDSLELYFLRITAADFIAKPIAIILIKM